MSFENNVLGTKSQKQPFLSSHLFSTCATEFDCLPPVVGIIKLSTTFNDNTVLAHSNYSSYLNVCRSILLSQRSKEGRSQSKQPLE